MPYPQEPAGPHRHRVSARSLDHFRTRVYGGRESYAEKVERLRKTEEENNKEQEK